MSNEVIVGLDKFVVGLPYPKMPEGAELAKLSVDERQEIQQQQKQYIALGKHIESMAKIDDNFFVEKTKQKGLKRFGVKSGLTGTPLFFLQLGCINKTWVINFEWNPSKHSHADRDEFLATLSTMLYDHYEELYVCGVISRAEFCVDVCGEDISNLVLVEKGRKAYEKFAATTTYSGRRGGAHVLTIYDKGKQLGESDQRIRIEVRIKRRDITLQQLVEESYAIQNPFSNAIIVDVNRLQLVAQELNMPSLVGRIKELGLYGAVKSKVARQKLFSRLQQEAVDWWQPEQFWMQHLALLKGLKPTEYQKAFPASVSVTEAHEV